MKLYLEAIARGLPSLAHDRTLANNLAFNSTLIRVYDLLNLPDFFSLGRWAITIKD